MAEDTATWCVKLHIDSEQAAQQTAEALTRQARAMAPRCSQVAEKIWPADRAAVFLLEDLLKDWIEDTVIAQWQGPRGREDFAHLLRLDLVTGYLGEVNWREIAEAYLRDVQ